MNLTFTCTKIEEGENSYRVYLECKKPDVFDELFGVMWIRGDKLDDKEYKRTYALGKKFKVSVEEE